MSNLQLYQQPNALAVIPSMDSEIAIALQSTIFSSLDQKTAYNIIRDAITKAYVLAKFECPIGSELQVLSDETMKIFQSRFGSIREKEIDICFTRGVMGDYGKYMGLALPAFTMFIQSYLKEESRIKLLTPMEEKKEPSLQERFEIAKNLALSTLQQFMGGQSIELQGATVYRFLAKLKIIQYSDEEQADFMEGAKSIVINNKQREKFTSLDKHVRTTIEKELNDLTLLDTKIKHMAQHNGLTNYFASLMMDEEKPIANLTNSINQQAKQYLNK